MRIRVISIAAVLALLALASGCGYTPLFGFPIEQGNIDAGRQAFIDHQCHRCHSVAGRRMPELAGAPPPILELGGPTSVAKTYAELLTSVINPNHMISERYRDQLRLNAEVPLESPMPTPQLDNMTVRQLIDIVAFLDSVYIETQAY